MIEGKNIICISQTTWHGEFTKSTVQLLSLLAEKNTIVFVEYPFTVKDVVMSLLGKQRAQVSRMLGFKKRIVEEKTDDGAIVKHLVMPPVLPVDFIKNESIFQKFFSINVFIYKNQLRKIIKKLKLNNPIIITAYNPMYGLPMIGKLNEYLNVYYCYDGMDTQRHKSRIYSIEQQFCKQVDGIITTSDYLNAEKHKLNAQSYVVKNGVDFKLFEPHAKKNVSSPSAQKKVGYIGTLDFRFDIDIMEYVIQELPQVLFEFTGYLLNQNIKERLSKYDNVAFFKSVKAHEVPELLSKYDLGIIPYKMDEVNKNIYPLKINEYLAVGVPVVMTAFANLTDFKAMVKSAENKILFKSYIEHELKHDNDLLIKERIEFAKLNSWESRVVEFGDFLEKIIENKYSF
ncbi:glycosyltransferase [Flavobacterium chungangense]|uniref:Glycosyl transferase family 1 n=1 Tax=Flavobacterium chungangense TaxID=554283 RepID=A0A6V6ZE24_9FLAO|nr:glycosyltransferase [Flavobacterium chungangense]CAD0009806.1 glycosyl transferase family 1 [Flavobacterium chungangense]